MNKKQLLTLIICMIVFAPICYAEVDPFPQSRGSVYDYGDDIPDVCFFGESPKWNGDKVTSDEWFKLTDFLKVTFIMEAGDVLGYEGYNGWAVLSEMNEIANDTLKPIFMENALKAIFLRDYKTKA